VFGQVVSGNRPNGPTNQQHETASNQAPTPQPRTPASNHPGEQNQNPADLTSGQNPKGAQNGDGFFNAKFTDYAIVLLTVGLVAVGAIQACIYSRQAKLMRLALRATLQSNRAAMKGARASETQARALVAAEKPVIGLERLNLVIDGSDDKPTPAPAGEPPETGALEFWIHNSGRTSATIVEYCIVPHIGERLPASPIYTLRVVAENIIGVGDSVQFGPTAPYRIDDTRRRAVFSAEQWLWAYGFVAYRDFLEDIYEIGFCGYWNFAAVDNGSGGNFILIPRPSYAFTRKRES
jgi:hypothetical protein